MRRIVWNARKQSIISTQEKLRYTGEVIWIVAVTLASLKERIESKLNFQKFTLKYFYMFRTMTLKSLFIIANTTKWLRIHSPLDKVPSLWHQQRRTECRWCWIWGQTTNSKTHQHRLESATTECKSLCIQVFIYNLGIFSNGGILTAFLMLCKNYICYCFSFQILYWEILTICNCANIFTILTTY